MEAKDVIKDADADDGLSVVEVNLGGNADVSLHLAFRREGELVPLRELVSEPLAPSVPSVEFWGKKNVGSQERGEAARIKLAMTSICRYLNTGGILQDLYHAASFLDDLLRNQGHKPIELKVPGFYLLTTGLNDEGEHEHLFAADDGGFEGIRWVEGRFIEVVDLSDVLKEGEVDSASTDEVDLLPEAGLSTAKGSEEAPGV